MKKFLVIAIFLLLPPSMARAGAHAYLGISGTAVDYPRGVGEDSDLLAAGTFRAGVDSDLMGIRFESDIEQSWLSRPYSSAAPCSSDTERSGLFYLNERCSGRVDSHLTIDRLMLKGGSGGFDFTVGRQPINLATTFYFSSNDFFAPFSETQFFRQYRPGVDAVRFDYGPRPLTQISMIEVLAYDFSPDRPGGWSRSPDFRRSSSLIRYLDNSTGFETVFIAGTVRDVLIVGAGGAGEINDWLGVTAEAHYGRLESGGGDYFVATVGIDHRYESSFNWRLECFYNGNFRNQAADTARSAIAAAARPGRDYFALGMGYEFTPLLTGELLAATNFTDDSRVFSFYFLESLSDNSEISLTMSRGYGDPPAAAGGGSEYGAVAESVVISLRFYL